MLMMMALDGQGGEEPVLGCTHESVETIRLLAAASQNWLGRMQSSKRCCAGVANLSSVGEKAGHDPRQHRICATAL